MRVSRRLQGVGRWGRGLIDDHEDLCMLMKTFEYQSLNSMIGPQAAEGLVPGQTWSAQIKTAKY
jgi:hypothetical protein